MLIPNWLVICLPDVTAYEKIFKASPVSTMCLHAGGDEGLGMRLSLLCKCVFIFLLHTHTHSCCCRGHKESGDRPVGPGETVSLSSEIEGKQQALFQWLLSCGYCINKKKPICYQLKFGK